MGEVMINIMDFSDQYSREGTFNSGLAIVFMLDNLKKRRIVAKMENDYDTRFKMDEEIMKLLLEKAKEDELAMHMAYWQKAEDCLDLIHEAKTNNGGKILKETIRFFEYWEIELELLQGKHGMGMPTKEDPRLAAMKT